MNTAAAAPRAGAALSSFDLGLYALVVLVWGSSWMAMRLQLGAVAPEVSILWRFALAAPIMFAWAWARGQRLAFPLADHLRFLGLGATLFSTNFVLFYYASFSVPSGLIAVVFSLASILNLLAGARLLGLRIEPRVAVAGLIGVAGVCLMFAPEFAGHTLGREAALGLGLSLCGTLSFCAANLQSVAGQRRGLPVVSSTAWGMLYGAALLALYALLRGRTFAIEPSARYLLSLAWLALPATVAGFVAYLTLLRRIGSARAGYTTVLFPVVALALSTVFEGYRWSALSATGLCLVVVGNFLVLRPRGNPSALAQRPLDPAVRHQPD